MKYVIEDFYLEFRHPFTIAHGSRNGTDIVLLTVEHDGYSGTGEASLPPYLVETPQSVRNFIENVFIKGINLQRPLNDNLALLRSCDNNYAAKACVDIALHNWYAASQNVSIRELLHIDSANNPWCTFTIGMGDRKSTLLKLMEAEDFQILKVKLGGHNDRELVQWIREETNKPLCVDVNQGWKSKERALEMINWLDDKNVLFVEQPLPKLMVDEMAWLYEKSNLTLVADESVQVPEDVSKMTGLFHGINIKLMKCGGIGSGMEMIRLARRHQLKVLIGSMSETGCGIHAAAQMAPLADYVDLDGPVLTKNNPFDRVRYEGGKIIPVK